MFIKGVTLVATTVMGILVGFLLGQMPTITPSEYANAGAYTAPMPTKPTNEVSNTPAPQIVSHVVETQPTAEEMEVTSRPQVPTPPSVLPQQKPPTPMTRSTPRESIIDIPDRQLRIQNINYLRDQYRLSYRETVSQTSDIVLQLAMNAFFECRGEGAKCMAAVTHVVINRLNDDRFPQTVKGVLIAPGQYSWKPTQARITRSLTDREKTEVWGTAVSTVYSVLLGDIADPTKGSLYFCNPKVSKVKFCQNLNRRKRTVIGNHVFG